MSYNLDPSDTNRFQGMELVFERIEGLKPGEVFRMKLIDTSILSKTRYLIYEWLNLNKIKPFFRVQTISMTGELTIIRKGMDISTIEEIKDKEVLDSTQEYLLQEMIRKNSGREAKDFILDKWKEGEIDEETHSKLWMRYKDVYS